MFAVVIIVMILIMVMVSFVMILAAFFHRTGLLVQRRLGLLKLAYDLCKLSLIEPNTATGQTVIDRYAMFYCFIQFVAAFWAPRLNTSFGCFRVREDVKNEKFL